MMSNIKIQRAGQGIPNLRIRMYAAADLERWTASEPTSSLPTGPDPYTPIRPCYNFENETLK